MNSINRRQFLKNLAFGATACAAMPLVAKVREFGFGDNNRFRNVRIDRDYKLLHLDGTIFKCGDCYGVGNNRMHGIDLRYDWSFYRIDEPEIVYNNYGKVIAYDSFGKHDRKPEDDIIVSREWVEWLINENRAYGSTEKYREVYRKYYEMLDADRRSKGMSGIDIEKALNENVITSVQWKI